MTDIVEAPTTDELVECVRCLAPIWRDRSIAVSDRRRLPDETVDELRAAGLLRVLQARRNGGFELGLSTHLQIVSAIAEGCPSTAWVVGVAHAHSWLLGHFPPAAQDDVYRPDPDALVAAVIRARGRAERVDGGYRLTGRWPFGSGCEHADWVVLGAEIVDASGRAVDEGDLLLPAADVVLNDDWHVDGLRATGSCSISVDGVFVPEHRFLSLGALAAGTTPGIGHHPNGWLHLASPTPVLAIALTGAAVGAARAGLEEFVRLVPSRTVAYVQPPPGDGAGMIQSDWSATHRLLGDAAIRIDEGELLLTRSAAAIDDHARRRAPMERELRARVRMDCAQGVRRCLEAVESLYLATGGSGLQSSNRIGQLLRDLQGINLHALLSIETNREMYGRVLLGLEAPLV
ncbi:MAG: hypothetical protein OEV40_12800 [Acidimicrobiia bacterium]|nr:hypothetical protein [Acidimicrobiia bacterium]